MANIAEDVKAIIVEKLGVDAAEVTETASFQNDLGADSLASHIKKAMLGSLSPRNPCLICLYFFS